MRIQGRAHSDSAARASLHGDAGSAALAGAAGDVADGAVPEVAAGGGVAGAAGVVGGVVDGVSADGVRTTGPVAVAGASCTSAGDGGVAAFCFV